MKVKLHFICILLSINALFAFDKFDAFVDSLSQKIVNDIRMTGKKNIAVPDFILNDKATDFGNFFSDELVKRLLVSNFNVRRKELINKKLKELKISVSDIYGLESGALQELAMVLSVDFIILGKIQDPAPDANLQIQIEIISAETGERYKFLTESITKDDKLKKMLGYTLPGKLTIFTYPSGVSVYLDNEAEGETKNNGLTLLVEPGHHTIALKKEGFTDFIKSLIIKEGQEQILKVKYISHPLAPLSSASKACFTSMIIPGAGVGCLSPYGCARIAYPSFSIGDIARYSALAFYCAGTLYLADRFLFEEKNFLTEECRESYKKSRNRVLNTELKVTAICYGINVITSFIAGLTVPATKKVVEITCDSSNDIIKLGLTYSLR